MSVASYLEEIKKNKNLILTTSEQQLEDYKKGLTSTWLISMKKILETTPKAIEILKLLSFIDTSS